jgi:HK97 family phage major capsid protein
VSVDSRALLERAANVLSEQRAILTSGDEVSPEDRERYDRLDSEYERLVNQAEDIRKVEERAASVDKLREAIAPTVEAARDERRDPTEGELIRGLFTGERRTILGAPDKPEFRALSTSTDTIDQSFYDTVTVYERTLSPFFRPDVFTLIESARGENLTIPRITADVSHGGTVTAQAAGITEADTTFSSVVLGAYKYAITQLYSNELAQDASIPLTTLIAESATRELMIDIGAHLTTGTDTTQPNGIVTAAGNGGTAGGTATGSSFDTFFSPADLLSLKYSLAAPYRARGSWLVSTTALRKMRSARDSNGAFLWDMSLVAGAPPTFDGNPVYENPAMAAVASVSKSVVFGDLKRYFVRRAGGVRVDVSTDYKFANDQVALRTIMRVDGDLIDTSAVNYLISANT